MEQRRGPKRAAVNKQYCYAVQDKSLGICAANLMLATMDIKPPAKSYCESIAVNVSNEMAAFNDDDLDEIRKEKINDNLIRGLQGNKAKKIAISVDSRYDSTSFGTRGRMG